MRSLTGRRGRRCGDTAGACQGWHDRRRRTRCRGRRGRVCSRQCGRSWSCRMLRRFRRRRFPSRGCRRPTHRRPRRHLQFHWCGVRPASRGERHPRCEDRKPSGPHAHETRAQALAFPSNRRRLIAPRRSTAGCTTGNHDSPARLLKGVARDAHVRVLLEETAVIHVAQMEALLATGNSRWKTLRCTCRHSSKWHGLVWKAWTFRHGVQGDATIPGIHNLKIVRHCGAGTCQRQQDCRRDRESPHMNGLSSTRPEVECATG